MVQTHDLFVILLAEVLHHRDGLAGFTLLEARSLRAHVPTHARHLVGLVVAVASHHNGVFELIVHSLLGLEDLWWLSCVALPLLVKAHHLFINELKTVVDGKVLRNIIDNEVDTSLEDPRTREETRPSLHCLVEDLRLGRHEESWVAADLAKFGIAHLRLNDGIYEGQREGMLFHLHGVQVVQGELRHARNANDELAAEVGLLSLEVNRLVDLLGTEDVIAH